MSDITQIPNGSPELDVLAAEHGWRRLENAERRLLRLGEDQLPDEMRARFFRRDSDGALVGKMIFTRCSSALADVILADAFLTLLEQILAVAARLSGSPADRLQISMKVRAPLMPGSVATIVAWVDGSSRDGVEVRCQILDSTGDIVADARALPDPEQ